MKCWKCKGTGRDIYEGGVIDLLCETCNGTGQVEPEITAEEFEAAYAARSEMTVEQVRELGLEVVPCDCGEEGCQGWAMVSRSVIEDLKQVNPTLDVPTVEVEPVVLTDENFLEVYDDVSRQIADGMVIPPSEVPEDLVITGPIEGVPNVESSDGGAGPDNKPAGSEDSGKPKQPAKRRAKRKATKKTK